MYKKINMALLAVAVFGALSVHAEDGNSLALTTTSPSVTIEGSAQTGGSSQEKKDVRPAGKEIRKDLNEARKEVRSDAKATRQAVAEERKNIRDDAKTLRASTTEARADMRRASTTEAKGEMRGKVKDEFREKRLEIAQKRMDLIGKRLDAAVDRVQKLTDRVSSALDKSSLEGNNVVAARSHLVEARARLEVSRTKVAQVKVAATLALASQTPKEEIKKVGVLVKDAVKSIQEAHRSVAQAISAIKPGINKPRATSTSKTETSNQ